MREGLRRAKLVGLPFFFSDAWAAPPTDYGITTREVRVTACAYSRKLLTGEPNGFAPGANTHSLSLSLSSHSDPSFITLSAEWVRPGGRLATDLHGYDDDDTTVNAESPVRYHTLYPTKFRPVTHPARHFQTDLYTRDR